ncbi:MAG: toll/interleukin-1 receptor domain-containing protein [Gammaproteobacteria bacterium]
MKNKTIFLSYRRDDSPGYVSKLEADLEAAFGVGRVFRDTQDIPGGTQWKKVIDENLRAAGALLLIIGPRWQSIWEARQGAPVDYVALELEEARRLGVPVFPITLDGVTLSPTLDLGVVSWLRERQFYDLSDRQSRWEGDFARLVTLLESADGIGKAQPAAAKPKRRIVPVVVALGVLIALGALALSYLTVDDPTIEAVPVDTPRLVPQPQQESDRLVKPVATTAPVASPVQERAIESWPAELPIVRGNWRGRDGEVFALTQDASGAVTLDSASLGALPGQFSDRRPRLFTLDNGRGISGEFAVSASDDRMIGFLIVNGRKQYETLVPAN